MADMQDTVSKLIAGINKDLGKKVAIDPKTEVMTQVDQWIEMPEWFRFPMGKDVDEKGRTTGVPCGQYVQLIGKPDSGKTSIMISAMVACQKQGGIVFLLEVEGKFPFDRFKRFGGSLDALIPMQVDSLEEAWTAVDAIVEQIKVLRKQSPDLPILLVWDSIAVSVPDAILESEAGDSHYAVEAKINNKNARKFRQQVKRLNIAAILINHYYEKALKFPIGAVEKVVKGGQELQFLSMAILEVRRAGWITRTYKGRDQIVGVKVKLSPFKSHGSDIKGISEITMIADRIFFTDDKDAEAEARARIDHVFYGAELETVQDKEAEEKKPKKKKKSEE